MRTLILLASIIVALMASAAASQEATPAAVTLTPTFTPQPTDHAGWRAEQPAWDGTYRRIRVPILMYHYISTPPEDADEFRRNLSLSPEMFREHVEYIFYEGYTPISLYTLDEALLTGAPLPPKPVVLTFDDGYADHYTAAYPTLREFGFTATFFIITARADANDPNHLTWDQIREMSDAGMSMESHTKNHPELDGRNYDFVVYEVMGSIQSLEAYTGRVPHMFSFPVGRYDDVALTTLDTMPTIWRAVTTEPGDQHTSDNRLLLPRLRIHSTTGIPALAGLLNGG